MKLLQLEHPIHPIAYSPLLRHSPHGPDHHHFTFLKPISWPPSFLAPESDSVRKSKDASLSTWCINLIPDLTSFT